MRLAMTGKESPNNMCLSRVNMPEAKKVKHRTKSDYVLLASVFYPHCKKEKLLWMTKYEYWVSQAMQMSIKSSSSPPPPL